MPLRDHFHPPFSNRHSWDSVHGGLPMVISAALNRNLPSEFVAGPKIPKVDEYEVLIYDHNRRRELVAVIELVSPSNKDRPETRRLFVNKCAGLLQAGVSVTIVDIVTEYRANLYAELLDAVGESDPAVATPPQPIYAAACRSRAAMRGQALETWFHSLTIGQPFPQLPIWLTERLAVPLDLEPIYEETLKALRIT